MQDFRNLRVWHAAKQLSSKTIVSLPLRESRRVPGLRAQICRAAESIHANIAEGCGRSSSREFLHFLTISIGSTNELDSHLESALDLRIISTSVHAGLLNEIVVVRKMLTALHDAVQGRIDDGEKDSES